MWCVKFWRKKLSPSNYTNLEGDGEEIREKKTEDEEKMRVWSQIGRKGKGT